jgi:hypothetical protein
VNGSCGQFVDSTAATVTVCQPPVITAQPVDPPPIYPNTGQVVTMTATGTNVTYQWYQSTTPGDVSMPVGGATDSTLSIYSIPGTQYYWVRVTGTCGSVDSIAVSVSVYPTITQQPASVAVTTGSSATLKVRATGNYLHYQWFNLDTGAAVGTDSTTLMTGPMTVTTHFYCQVRSGTAVVSSYGATVSICYAFTINGVTVGPVDLNNGCRSLSVNYTFKLGDTIKWYKGAAGDTTIDVTPTVNVGNLWVCPADAGSYWYRVIRTVLGGTCTGDSPAVSAP